MPLSINVGLSRKASKDYQSTGVSINVTAELDQSLLAKPDELKQQIDDLYGQAEAALARQTQQHRPPASTPERNGRPNGAGGYRNGNGRGYRPNGRSNGTPADNGTMTESQRRCINSIATRLGTDPHQESIDIIGVALDQLSVRQASELIDHLRTIQPANDNGGGR